MTESTQKDKMKELKEVMSVIDRPYFLMGGAALWAYRDNAFPGGNAKSFGIGIWGKDDKYQEELNKKLEEMGFKVERHKGTVVQAIGTLRLLIFFFFKDRDEWWVHREPKKKWASIPDRFHELEEIEFQGLKVKVPSPIEDYLLWCYGEKWRDKTQTNSSYPPARILK